MPAKATFGEFQAWFATMPNRLHGAMRRGLLSASMRAIPVVRKSAREAPPANPAGKGTGGAFNTGDYVRAWKSEPTKTGAVLYNTKLYAAVIEEGRRPGKGVPIDALWPWVLRKLMGAQKGPGKTKARRKAEKVVRSTKKAIRKARGGAKKATKAVRKLVRAVRQIGKKPRPKRLPNPAKQAEAAARRQAGAAERQKAAAERMKSREEEARKIAKGVSFAIAKRGLRGRKVLDRVLPKLGDLAGQEILREVLADLKKGV